MARKLPPIPKFAPTLLGPVSVTRVKDPKDDKQRECFGVCRYGSRTIVLDADMCDTAAWHTYWHEWTHLVLWDSGIVANKALAERLCDAFANARVREMLDA